MAAGCLEVSAFKGYLIGNALAGICSLETVNFRPLQAQLDNNFADALLQCDLALYWGKSPGRPPPESVGRVTRTFKAF